jgi:hypothetical protein
MRLQVKLLLGPYKKKVCSDNYRGGSASVGVMHQSVNSAAGEPGCSVLCRQREISSVPLPKVTKQKFRKLKVGNLNMPIEDLKKVIALQRTSLCWHFETKIGRNLYAECGA